VIRLDESRPHCGGKVVLVIVAALK